MLTLFGPTQPFCDGINRRNFRKIGGLSMADILRTEARAGGRPSHKAIIWKRRKQSATNSGPSLPTSPAPRFAKRA
jgi:hypothetical protein